MNLNQVTEKIKQNILALCHCERGEAIQKIINKWIALSQAPRNDEKPLSIRMREFAVEKYNKYKNALMLIGSILLCAFTWVIGILVGKSVINFTSLFWYDILFKPAFTPPFWLYTAVGGIMYLLTSMALYLVLNSENINQEALLDKLKKFRINPEPYPKEGNKKLALLVLGIYLFLSVLLIPVFFGLNSALGTLIIAFLMFISVFIMLYKFYKIIIPASLLMIPSVLWSAYLVGLSFTFWLLNNTQWVMWSFKHKLL